MKKISFVSLLSVFLIFVVLSRSLKISHEPSITSPLPDFLNIGQNHQVSTLEQWQPTISRILGAFTVNAPTISAKSSIIYDLTSEKVLYDKNSDQALPMASLTKIMTAIIAIDNKRLDDRYLVKKENLVGENSMGLTPGEVLTQEELLYGLALVSANDASEVLASDTLGRESFIEAMNQKAKALGLQNTHFSNPTGLEGDGVQQTTAKELLILTRYALKNYPEFRKVVSTVDHTIPSSFTHKDFELFNETNLLTSYPGVKGVKDGYTPEAGLCLVTYLNYQGHEIIGVILGSKERRQEMKDLLDYSLLSEGITPPKHQ